MIWDRFVISCQDLPWPPPMEDALPEVDDSDKEAGGNMSDVRDAIHNAMDSVNRFVRMNKVTVMMPTTIIIELK